MRPFTQYVIPRTTSALATRHPFFRPSRPQDSGGRFKVYLSLCVGSKVYLSLHQSIPGCFNLDLGPFVSLRPHSHHSKPGTPSPAPKPLTTVTNRFITS
jgi:hypothetical protein